MTISERVAALRNEMAEAALQAGRDPKEILLCAATKMNNAGAIREAVAAGVDLCGENRVQEFTEKYPLHAYDGVPVHFIGHLQKNKAKLICGNVDMIESVDSPALLTLLNRICAERGIVQDILLEVNIGGESAKSGVSPDALPELAAMAGECSALRLRGLMTVPPKAETPLERRLFFEKMYQLFVDTQLKKYNNSFIDCLSMGMSADFREAIAAGSTMVRIGTAIFGPRNYNITGALL